MTRVFNHPSSEVTSFTSDSLQTNSKRFRRAPKCFEQTFKVFRGVFSVCVCVLVHTLDTCAAFVIVRVLCLVSVFKKMK